MQERTAVVTGATGQDGWYLVNKLLGEGWTVHAAVRDVRATEALFGQHPRLHAVRRDLRDPAPLRSLVANLRPQELYNLAGESSVAASFRDPQATWESNAHAVVHLLDAVRCDTPETRVYQSSSGEMFGSIPGGDIVHDESSALNPQSPYAAAKAAAHMLCRSYRESYGVRIACGILFNHESHRRGPQFLTRKVVDHVLALRAGASPGPLMLGNLKVQRDWGFAPDYVDGMIAILRQEAADGAAYRDYVLGTGRLHHVWELVDSAYALGGFELVWNLEGDVPTNWSASFAQSGEKAVVVDPTFIRAADPRAFSADPTRAHTELGWKPRIGLDVFLEDMLATPHQR